MQVRQRFSRLLFPLLAFSAISAGAQQLTGNPVSLGAPQSLDQLLPSNSNPFSGSISSAPPQPGVLDLTVQDAIDRGLKYNLGIVLSAQDSAQAKAARLKELSNLLPQINGSLRESETKVNLQAEGLSFQIPGINIGKSVQVSNSDLRVSVSEDLLDLHALDNTRAATAGVRAQAFTFNSARETVALAVAASYLLVLAAESQVEAAAADLQTADALHKLAQDREAAGLNPNIDTLRARVESQVRRQNLIVANNNLAKQRIGLLRTLGLPVHQQIRLTTLVHYKPLPPLTEAEAIQLALAQRPDFQAAQQQLKAAELRKKAAVAERLPSLGLSGDYGVLGTRPDNVFPTWSVNAGLKIPIFQGGKVESDIQKAEADLRQNRAQLDDLKGRIEQDIADAFLDVASAAEQVDVARSTLEYAQQTLTQSQDRFSAGVTNNIEVIQAQEALANASQQYISSLYSHNIAKVLLARAIGSAEKSVRLALAQEEFGAGQLPPAGQDIPPAPPLGGPPVGPAPAPVK